MKKIKKMPTLFNQQHIREFTDLRKGEIKLGECVSVLNPKKSLREGLEESNANFVIFGIPEDIGVKMNRGNGGAHTSFIPALKAFLNTQQNQFLKGDDILVIGYLDFFDDVIDFDSSNYKKADELLKNIDKKVSNLVHLIIKMNKIPIIIGGGHNNAYGNIKGLSLAKNSPINIVNLDAHTDLRYSEKRHSGNGFSYALSEGYLDKYFIFGIHENYTPQYIFEKIHNNTNLDYNTFEELEVYKVTSFKSEIQRATSFIENNFFGIEIDLDCIQYFPTSAMSPCGFTTQQARQFVYNFAKNNNASYLHICEGAPSLINEPTTTVLVGKYISYLISDFIKAKNL